MEEKRWEKENQEAQRIEEMLRKTIEQEEIPEGLSPENMRKFLEEHGNHKKKGRFRKWYGVTGVAACLVLILFVGGATWRMQGSKEEQSADSSFDSASNSVEQAETVEEKEILARSEQYDTTYDDLYQFFEEREQEIEKIGGFTRGELLEGAAAAEDAVYSAADGDGSQQQLQSAGAKADYADTNRQEAEVDEADIIKNDGRYLYQIIRNKDYSQAVQITDTSEGLKEAARIEGFENIGRLFVWEDTLVVFESCWAEEAQAGEEESGSEVAACSDVLQVGTAFQKIYIYDISDRENPKEEHVFNMKGSYLDSRLTDGYLYCFLNCGVETLGSRTQYEKYVPVLDGKAMEASSIYLPEDAQDLSYVVIASVDLRNPKEIKDARAMVSSADRVYVTASNIYVTDNLYDQKIQEEGIFSDKTDIVRFSYENGVICKEAQGSVKGILLDDMAISESGGYLRLAVTVNTFERKSITDDVSGNLIGYEIVNQTQDNSLYVLDEGLSVVGKIEGLAEDEQIYSARFMGDTGYFVTFRQVDPLFSVDLSDPENPKVLGELKISGFSEYLHFYSEDLLLGIGMEADEETGATNGMKLSMFDISNPSDVKEQDKYSLSQYDYSDGLYNYKAVLINTEKNLFGFFAEGWEEDEEEWKEDYLLFSYENGAFQQKMKISCDRDAGGIYSYASVRGTYIGDVFYLMYGDGRIEAYSLSDGSLLEKLSD